MCRKSKLREQIGFIKLLKSIPSKTRYKLIQQCQRKHLDAIPEIVLNFLKNKLTKSKSIISKLRPFRNLLRKLAMKRTSLRTKKRILSSQRGAGILSLLLPLIGGFLLK